MRGTWERATVALLNRCVPATVRDESQVTLCAYPDCAAAGQPCYVDSRAGGATPYWRPPRRALRRRARHPRGGGGGGGAPPRRVACEQMVTLDVSRTFAPAEAQLTRALVDGSFGGVRGVVIDLYLGAAEVLGFGVLTCVVLNAALLVLLRSCIKSLFYVALVLLLAGVADDRPRPFTAPSSRRPRRRSRRFAACRTARMLDRRRRSSCVRHRTRRHARGARPRWRWARGVGGR